MEKTKVLVVGSSLKDQGGIVTVIKNIEESKLKQKYNLRRIETYITSNSVKKILIFVQSLFMLFKELIFFKPEIVHIHMSEKGSFYRKTIIMLISKLFKKKVILHIHSASFDEFYNSNNYQKRFIKYILNKSDRLIVLSKQWKTYYSNIVPAEKISILYNGVYKVNENYQRNNDVPIGLFLGRLGKRKGTYDLIESIRELKDQKINCNFYFAGDGEIEEVKNKLKMYDIEDNVKVLGWVNSQEINGLLKKVDFLVLPSYNEGLPMAILESMNLNLPIISTYVGGIPEVIKNGENGYLINPGDVKQLTQALNSIVTNQKLRIYMGNNNKRVIRQGFDIQVLMDELSNIYVETNKY